MRKYSLIALLLASSGLMAQDVNNDFQSFRKGMLNQYDTFRKSVLDDYAKYLQGVWEEFDEFRGLERDRAPKPVAQPKAEAKPSTPQVLPTPDIAPLPKPAQPTNQPKTIAPVKLPFVTSPMELTFYGMTLKVSACKVKEVNATDHKQIAKAWGDYQTDANVKQVTASLQALSVAYGLNDWFTLELVRDFTGQLTGNTSGKVLLQHYLLTHMGYDIRLASTRTDLLLLVPFKQQVYGHNYLQIDGKKYYTFYGKGSTSHDKRVYTCRLPEDADAGRSLDLTFAGQGLLIQSGAVHTGEWSDGRLRLNVSVDEEMMEVLRHYPQMDVPCYAQSCISPEFHERLLGQMGVQLQGLSEKEAVSRLLHFVQHAFAYATDGEQHGYEKPYFIEENFYYPKNDCEDRAILFAFLVHNLLNLDVHLVHYPGHECTAVSFSSPLANGDGYHYNGATYYICDPTFIGASIGQCMPSYITTKPVIEEWY